TTKELKTKLAEQESYLAALRKVAEGETSEFQEFIKNLEGEKRKSTETGGEGGDGDKNEDYLKRLEAEKKYQEEILQLSLSAREPEDLEYQLRLERAGLFGKERTALTERELAVLEALEAQHEANLAQIDTEAHQKYLQQQQAAHDKEKQRRQTRFNEELAGIGSLEEAKLQLRDSLSAEELDKIDTIE